IRRAHDRPAERRPRRLPCGGGEGCPGRARGGRGAAFARQSRLSTPGLAATKLRRGVIAYIIRRLLYSIPVLIAPSFLILSLVSLSSDPLAVVRANPRFSPQSIPALTAHYHLNRPIPVRYVYWLKDFTLHKGGNSLLTNHPIWPDIRRVLRHTAQLVLISQLLAILLGVAIGVYSAVRQYSVFDYTFTTFSFIG